MTNPFSPCLNITCPHPDTCTANRKCLARVVDKPPVRYEVLDEEGILITEIRDPLTWPGVAQGLHHTFRHPDGSLWRVEEERELKVEEVIQTNDLRNEKDARIATGYQPIIKQWAGLRVRENDGWYFRRPAHLVPVTTPQADSTNNPKEVKTCATIPSATNESAETPTISTNLPPVASNVPPDSSNPTGGTEIPCIHDWYEGRCIHCEMPAKEFRRLKPSDPTFRNAVLDIVAEVFREAIELNTPHEPLPSNIFKAALNLKTK